MRFARLEARVVLATVAKRYQLDLADPTASLDLQPGATVAPANAVEMVPRAR
jgi:cytochrome P450